MTTQLFDLSGRTALITGSSRGIGRALAVGLARAGATVVLNGRDVARLEATRDELEAELLADQPASASRFLTADFDVTEAQAVDDAIEALTAKIGSLDILINNAGITHRSLMLDLDIEDWDRVIRTDLTSAFLVGRAVARGMLRRGRGKIINICSVQTDLARPSIAPYVAAKGGLRNLTRAMCAEWAPQGLNVNGIAPGYFETELTASLVADETFNSWIVGRTPARKWGQVEQLVGPAVFLASDASSFVNGQVIFVDGGMTVVV